MWVLRAAVGSGQEAVPATHLIPPAVPGLSGAPSSAALYSPATCRQDKKLKETFAQLQRENEELRRKLGGGGGGGGGGMGAHLAGINLAGGASGGGGRASRMAGMGMGMGLEDAGMGRRPSSAVAVRCALS